MPTSKRRSPLPWLILAALVLALIGTITFIGPLKILQQIIITFTEDTEYAPGYSEQAFRDIEIGDSEASVQTALGTPIHSNAVEPHTRWLYSADPSPDFATTGNPGPVSTYTVLRFGEDGHFSSAFGQLSHGSSKGMLGVSTSFSIGDGTNSLSLTNAGIDKLKADRATPEQIEARFGKPAAVFESRTAKWLEYSHSPGSTHYRMRKLGIDRDGNVCRKQSEIYWDWPANDRRPGEEADPGATPDAVITALEQIEALLGDS